MSEPTTTDILAHHEAGVLTLTFNRPGKKNAITAAMYQTLADALNAASRDEVVRVVVIQGADDVFTAGNDLADFLGNARELGTDNPTPVEQFLFALRDFPKPLIAAVAGPAVGIGTTLLLHCDLVYAGDNAAFSLPFVNLGLCPEAGASLLLPQLVGYTRAAEKLLLGEAFYADEALDMGLLNRIVPPHEVKAYAQAQAAKLAAKPMVSLLATKALLKAPQTQLAAVMSDELQAFGELLQGPAAKEAVRAVMDKRRPDFTGM
jgi:enoyl-CoA hydratase/carnithine racemase